MTATPSPEELVERLEALVGRELDIATVHSNPALIQRHNDNADELRAAAALIRELVVREKWQPIETAPKNGSTIILWSRYQSEPVTAAWAPRGKWVSRWDGVTVIEAQGDTYTDYAEPTSPTHWRPLPAPPVEAE